PSFASADGYRYAAEDQRTLVLFPQAPAMKARLGYGELVWIFSPRDGAPSPALAVTLTRRDFDVFGLSTLSSRGESRPAQGLQGAVGIRRGSSVAPDGSQLTSGVLGIVHR